MGSSFIAQIVSMVIHGKDATKYYYTLIILDLMDLWELQLYVLYIL